MALPVDFIPSAFLAVLLATTVSMIMPNNFLNGLKVLPITNFLANTPVVSPIAALNTLVFKSVDPTTPFQVFLIIFTGFKASLVLLNSSFNKNNSFACRSYSCLIVISKSSDVLLEFIKYQLNNCLMIEFLTRDLIYG